jgi:hypothetical protein
MLGDSWVAEQLANSQDRLGSIELQSDSIASNGRMTGELEGIRKEAIVV